MTFKKGNLALLGLLFSYPFIGGVLAQPSLMSPANQAVNTPWEVELKTFAAGAAVISRVTIHAQEAGSGVAPEPEEDFTIVVLPDTQRYSTNRDEFDPSFFKDQVDWIVANRAALNIVYVSHVGDLVQNYNNGNLDEWEHAANAMYRLENPQTTGLPEGIPYGVLPGNHDLSGSNTTFYNQFFGPAHFAGRSFYGGSAAPGNNDNYYTIFEAGSLKFLHFNIMWLADMNVVGPWMQTVAASHPDRLVFATTHHACDVGNPADFSNIGEDIYNTLKSNPNFFMLQGGHESGEGRRVDTFNGNQVHTILCNYQDFPNGGDGYLRLYRFSPSAGTIAATTYSPVIDAYRTQPNAAFTINKDFGITDAPTAPVVAAFTNVFNASTLTTLFAGEPGKSYEWYTVSDQGRSETWTFETESNLAPIAAPLGNLIVAEGEMLQRSLTAQDPNQTPQNLRWSLPSGPPGCTLSPDGLLRWPTTEADGPGVYAVQAVVEDDAPNPASTTVDFSIAVDELNQAPTLSLPAYQFVDVGTVFSLASLGTDADLPQNRLLYRFVSGQVPGMTLNETTGQFSWTPNEPQSGQLFPLVIEVSDNGSPPLVANDAVDLIVTENGRLALRPTFVPVFPAADSSSVPTRFQLVWPSFPGYLYGLETRSGWTDPWQSLGTRQATAMTLPFGEITTNGARLRGQYRLQLMSK